ncbi:hypothetical protein NDU88_005431, partial [Pleurodeles waltl]
SSKGCQKKPRRTQYQPTHPTRSRDEDAWRSEDGTGDKEEQHTTARKMPRRRRKQVSARRRRQWN